MRVILAKRLPAAWWLLISLAVLLMPNAASAQPYPVPPTWGGDMLDRPRLTGDWGGWRDELGKMGIVLDVDLLLTPQVNITGGRNTGGNLWGNLDYTLNIDTQKAGYGPAVSSSSRPMRALAATFSMMSARSSRSIPRRCCPVSMIEPPH